jgi:hypothetical protein
MCPKHTGTNHGNNVRKYTTPGITTVKTRHK